MSELRPCPFCGSEDVATWVGANNGTCTYIYCNRCSSRVIGTWGGNEEDKLGRRDAIKKWNTRPIEDALRAKLDEVRRILNKAHIDFDLSGRADIICEALAELEVTNE